MEKATPKEDEEEGLLAIDTTRTDYSTGKLVCFFFLCVLGRDTNLKYL